MNKSIKFLTITIMLLFVITSAANSQYGRFNRNSVRQPLDFCMNIPGLDDQQKARITEVNDAHREKIDELRLKRQNAATFEEMNEIGAQMLLQHNEHIKQVKALLTEEQKEYLNNTYFGMGPHGLRQAPAYGRGAGRGYGRDIAPGRGYGRGRGMAGRGYGGRGLGPCGAGYGPGFRF